MRNMGGGCLRRWGFVDLLSGTSPGTRHDITGSTLLRRASSYEHAPIELLHPTTRSIPGRRTLRRSSNSRSRGAFALDDSNNVRGEAMTSRFRFGFLALTWLVTSSDAPSESKSASPAHMNRLAKEKSPYLLQHAHNPVDWYPWGEEAFARARRENKPIFLSIGYSTCHWCHVMAHESFEDEKIAAIMNRQFVNIKVDREERPDVDRVYMTFVQATTGGGGWPMSVWLTPDLKPFVGGTYFPPEDRYGQPAFRSVLQRIATAWKENQEKIVEQGARIV